MRFSSRTNLAAPILLPLGTSVSLNSGLLMALGATGAGGLCSELKRRDCRSHGEALSLGRLLIFVMQGELDSTGLDSFETMEALARPKAALADTNDFSTSTMRRLLAALSFFSK